MAARASASSSSASCWRRWAAACCARRTSPRRAGGDGDPECRHEAQKNALLPGIADGERCATLAFTEAERALGRDGDGHDRHRPAATTGCDGAKSFVLDGHTADLIVVLARGRASAGDEGLSFFTVRGDAPGCAPRCSRRWTRRASWRG